MYAIGGPFQISREHLHFSVFFKPYYVGLMWQSNNFCRIFNHLSQICRQIWHEFHIMSKQLHSLAGVLIMWVQWDNYNQTCDLVQYLIRGFVCRVLSALHIAVVQVVKQRHSTTQNNRGKWRHVIPSVAMTTDLPGWRLLFCTFWRWFSTIFYREDTRYHKCDTPDKLIKREH